MLFPALERLLETPNGKSTRLWPYFPLYFLPSLLYGFIGSLPQPLQRFILLKIIAVKSNSKNNDILDIVEGAIKFIHYRNMLNLLYMTKFEYREINELQFDKINKFHDKLYLYYGKNDKWCPETFYKDLKIKFPNIESEIDQMGVSHAFVIGDSHKIANKLSEFIQK